jgi:acetylornithine deacetylase/succinyl-diaminopimelate desuccinylase-like protein
MEHLNKIAYEKRNVRSPLHAKTRIYIEQQMKNLGYEVTLQDTVSVRTWLPNYHIAASIRNIAARKKGTDSRGSVMIMTHYDSVTTGPGAADAGYGVAAMLESARALMKTNPLKNDIIFLFNDAEEGGLMGANAFLMEHPWLRDVKTIVNGYGMLKL